MASQVSPPHDVLAHDPVVRSAWHPVALAREIPTDTPCSATVLGEEIVLWRGPSEVHAWQDLCLHRGVRLSLGRVVDGCALRCAYHGWTYDESGQCSHLPAHPSLHPPEKARAKTYLCRESAGLIWVCLDAVAATVAEFAEFAEFAEIVDPDFRSIPCGPYPTDAGAPRLIENFLDVAHLPIVHAGSLGLPDQAEIAPYEVDWIDNRPIAREIRVFQPHPEGTRGPTEVTYEYGVLSPFCVYLRKHLNTTDRFSLVFAVRPVSENRSVAYFTAFLNYGDPTADPQIVEFQNQIFAQDLPIVCSQRPEKLPLDLAAELHLPSDRLAIAYRKYIRTVGLTFGTA